MLQTSDMLFFHEFWTFQSTGSPCMKNESWLSILRAAVRSEIQAGQRSTALAHLTTNSLVLLANDYLPDNVKNGAGGAHSGTTLSQRPQDGAAWFRNTPYRTTVAFMCFEKLLPCGRL